MIYKMKAFVGPCRVKEAADMIRAAGINVTLEGTEHVYFESEGQTSEGAAHNMMVDYERKHGVAFACRSMFLPKPA